MLHPQHPQSLRRNRWPRLGPVLQLIQPLNICRRQSPSSYLQQGPHHLPHHVSQKRPPMHREPQFFPILRALQFRRKNLPHHIPFPIVVFRSRRSRKRREIVYSHKPRRCLFHRLFIQRKRVVQHIAPQHRRHHLPPINPVPVNFPFRRPSRIEIRPRFFRSHDPDRRRQQRIQRPLKLLRRKRRLRPETPHLSQGMHTRIRASRAVQLHILLRQPPQHGHQFALHCRFICLDLPTVEIRPVVRNRQLDISHRLPRPGHFGVRRLAAAFAISPPPTNDLSSPTAPLPRLLRHPNLPRAIPSLLPASVAQSLLTVLLGSSSPRPPN